DRSRRNAQKTFATQSANRRHAPFCERGSLTVGSRQNYPTGCGRRAKWGSNRSSKQPLRFVPHIGRRSWSHSCSTHCVALLGITSCFIRTSPSSREGTK